VWHAILTTSETINGLRAELVLLRAATPLKQCMPGLKPQSVQTSGTTKYLKIDEVENPNFMAAIQRSWPPNVKVDVWF
jgi:hypothetical protein